MTTNKLEELVSIIMPCYNSSKFIRESIASVLKQTYKNIELIIIDDVSTDNSINIIREFNDVRVKLITSEHNGGAGVCRNKGIDAAQGRYIAFLDSDDIWRDDKLELQIAFMKNNNYALTYTHYQCFSNKGQGKIVIPPQSITYDKLLYCNIIGCLTAIYDTNVIGKQYMPLIRKRQDMGLWLKILRICGKGYCYPAILADYRTDSGMTQNKFDAAKYQWIFYRTELNFNVLKSLKYFIGYAYNGIIKK